MKAQRNKQVILDSLAAMARRAGRTPTRREFVSRSEIPESAVLQFFPSWNAALRAAGLPPYTLNLRLDDREMLVDWAFVARRTGKIPARRAYRHLGQRDPRTLSRRFGSWSRIPDAFRKFAQGNPEWADVLALLPPPAPTPSPKPLPNSPPRRAPNSAPTPVILSRAQDPGVIAAQPKTVPAATIPASSFLTSNNSRALRQPPSSPAKLRYPPLDHRPTYGQPMDFRGLRHEPVNEQGVVLLFGMVAKELGYTVEAVQSGFPDCEAKRQVAPDRWQRVHLEFEFESRNFRDHGHPLTGCDVIVCWRHNWPACPPHLEILELSSFLKTLPASAP
ncbi:MAG TPA: hypothetical protein VL975_00075 [Candidatus Micrarchaeia archaeon]|nr:hypothetical protein [Candidatus Micrarchaeia archaeon]